MSFWRSKRGVLTLGIVLLLALFLIRPGANRLRTRIIKSISLALGRPVDVASVKVRLLPQPGFDLEDFVIHDDPAFSAEPMLRAQEVTASLRMAPLLRGKLEIARLNLTEPSLNLVRNAEGHWNVESLIERAAKIPVAPTSKAKTEMRPGFPYIEADRGRINIKFGLEKKPYALTEADFALWQDSENSWGTRLDARPLRTDFNLSDTGIVRVSGSWQRAATLRETPLQFTLEWDRAQLGQATKLAYGSDKGWRGGLKVSAALTGTPADLTIAATAMVQDFRRYDIFGGGDLRLTAQCNGRYSSLDHELSDVACIAPVGDGKITLNGSVGRPFASGVYNLALGAQDLPIQSLLAFARHAKQGLPDDLLGSGRLNASMTFRRTGNAGTTGVMWQGSGETSGFQLGSKFTKTELMLGRIPFALSAAANPKSRTAFRGAAPPLSQARLSQPRLSQVRLDIGPFNLAIGRPAPATVRGWASRSGYGFTVEGDTQVQRLLQLARTAGIPAPQPVVEGWAKVDLQIAGAWTGFAAPRAMGKAQLHAIRAEAQGLNGPLEILFADVLLEPDQVSVLNLTASAADTSWRGTLALPRRCSVVDSCPIRFDLHADDIATDRLNQLVNPFIPKRPWYSFLSPQATGVPYLRTVYALGKVTADSVAVHKLVANRVSANVELNKGKLRLLDLRGEVLGGRHTGEWEADFTAKPPQYSGNGRLDAVALDQLSESMNDNWITGSATATYRVRTSGLVASDLFASAAGTMKIDAGGGFLPHLAIPEGTGPLQMRRLSARLVLQDGRFEIQEGKLETSTDLYQLSGTASLTRDLNLKLTRQGAPGYDITGTVTEPRVSQFQHPETRAALKP